MTSGPELVNHKVLIDVTEPTATLRDRPQVTFTPITELDIAEIGDVFKIAAARTKRRWFLSGDLVLTP